MKTVIAIFCQSIDQEGVPFKDPHYWDAYSDLLLVLAELGAQAYLVANNSTYIGNGVFSEAYFLPAKGPVNTLQKVGKIQADLVFNRGNFRGRDVAILNPDFVVNVGADKITTYNLFSQFQPFSIPCYTKSELLAAFETIKSDLIVVKKPSSRAGHGVYIGKKPIVLAHIPDAYPLLVQEFLDSSMGISGHIHGMHDLRVEVGGGEIWGCYIRQPKPGSLKANIAQGGSKIILTHRDVPSEVVDMVLHIDAYFKDYPRFYGLDFMYTKLGWKLIEINSRKLGLVAIAGGPGSKYTLYKLGQYLIDVAPT